MRKHTELLTELEGREGRRVELQPEVFPLPKCGNDGPADHGVLEGRAASELDDHLSVVRHGAARDAPAHAGRLEHVVFIAIAVRGLSPAWHLAHPERVGRRR